MCGRFTLTIHQFGSVIESLSDLGQAVHVDPELVASYRPRYNVAPGNSHWILRSKAGRRELLPADWGLINHWSKDPSVAFKQINARAETLAQRPAYREAFRQRRCVIPADGFYEWTGPKGARQPIWFHPPSPGQLILFAGLYEGWTDPRTGEVRRTFTVITTEPNLVVREVHDRMPALLAPAAVEAWLTGDRPGDVLRAAPDDMLVPQPASPRVNSAANDDPRLLDVDDPEAKRQLSLF
jgi:putative SOS response-associated peptidase YedK